MRLNVVAVAVVFLIGIAFPSFAEELVLAKIGQTRITETDLNRIISYYDADKQKALAQNPTYRATLVQRIVQAAVVSKMAKDKDYPEIPAIKEQMALLLSDFLATEYIKREVISKIVVPEEDIQFYYKTHLDDFGSPAMIKARHIYFKTDESISSESRGQTEKKAESVLKQLKNGADFTKMAAEYSEDDNTKTNGGDLGYFRKGKMSPEFEKVAFAMKKGEISDLVKTPKGIHIIKVEEYQEPSYKPLEMVREKIHEKIFTDLKKTRVEEFVKDALQKAEVQFNFEPLLPKQGNAQ